MLRNGRLSDYVHAAFSGIRTIIRLRVLSTYNSFTRWLVKDCFLQSAFVKKAAMENLRYSADRMDRRLQDPARDPPRPSGDDHRHRKRQDHRHQGEPVDQGVQEQPAAGLWSGPTP